MNIKIEEKDKTHHKITIAKDEIRVKIAKSKLDEKDKVLKIVDYIVAKVPYSGFTLRGIIRLDRDSVDMKTENGKTNIWVDIKELKQQFLNSPERIIYFPKGSNVILR